MALAALSAVLLIWSVYTAVLLSRKPQAVSRAEWTKELNQLWSGFLGTGRPVTVVIADPLFVPRE